MELKDWLKSINETKTNLIDNDSTLEPKYLPYIVNRCMSGQIDSLMFANEMNISTHLDNKLQYDFLLYTLRKKKRFSPWMRKDELSNLSIVKEYYGYSDEKARQVLPLLTEDQLNIITRRLNTGGLK
tara:strand:- start:441 stop:821 length:381 start_codon:yes stop_codon:yes gene_type:complete